MNRSLPVRLCAPLLILALLLPASASASDHLVVASGAGYKKMVDALAAAYEAKHGPSVDRLYGNMAQTLAQAESGGVVDVVVGAGFFLDKSGLAFASRHVLGNGHLVVACAKGVKRFVSPRDLLDPAVERIAMPDVKRAIYGRAAMQYLKGTGLYEQVKDKLVMVATVPQVASYVVAAEVDMGFINGTHALAVEGRIGSWTAAAQEHYEPIEIMAAVTPDAPHKDMLPDFLDFLGSERATTIIRAHGL